MKTEDLKSYFVLKALKPVIALLITIGVWVLVYLTQHFFEDKNQAFKSNNINLEAKIASIQSEIERSKSSYQIWEKIKLGNFDVVGVRVEAAKKIIDDLRQSYLINSLDINLSNPLIRKDILKQKVGLDYSEIFMKFDSYADTEVYKFIDGLNKKMPGILHYTNVEIKALDVEIDDAVIQSIKKGGYKDLVKVRLDMIWQDVINLKDENAKSNK